MNQARERDGNRQVEVQVIESIDKEEFSGTLEAYLGRGFELVESDIGTNELNEPTYRAIVKKVVRDE